MHYNLLNNNFWTITARMSTLIYANCVSAWCQFNYSCLVFSKLLVFILVEEFVAGFLGSKQLIKLNGYSKKMHHFVIRVLQLCSLLGGQKVKKLQTNCYKNCIYLVENLMNIISKGCPRFFAFGFDARDYERKCCVFWRALCTSTSTAWYVYTYVHECKSERCIVIWSLSIFSVVQFRV